MDRALSMSTSIADRQDPVYPLAEQSPSRPYLGLLLRLVSQHYAQEVDAALRAAGFTDIRPAHANVFPFVPPEGIHVSELARLARVRKQTTAEAVAQLERLGYVERRPDPHDRRARLVYLTERGKAVGPIAAAAASRVIGHWAELTSAEELDNLRESLLRLLIALRGESDSVETAGER